MLSDTPHPEFVRLLQASDAELIQWSPEKLEAELAKAHDFQSEGLWTDALMAYINEQGPDNYVHLHWVSERYYADKLKDPNTDRHDFGYYYTIGYARIVALVLRYHDNMGYDRNDFYFIRGFLAHHFPDKANTSILEVGAGSGKLLADLGHAGYTNTEGMEMAAAALREARENVRDVLGEEAIHAMSFIDFRKMYPERRYDVLIHAHLIEHIPPSQTAQFLAACYDTIKPGGYMVIITPSRLSGPHDVTRYFRTGGSEPEGFHLWEFTLNDLERVLSEAGFGGFATVRSLPTLNDWWDGVPTEASFALKRDKESELLAMAWADRKPIVDGMYYVGMVCQKPASG